jgi:hypothetical protein
MRARNHVPEPGVALPDRLPSDQLPFPCGLLVGGDLDRRGRSSGLPRMAVSAARKSWFRVDTAICLLVVEAVDADDAWASPIGAGSQPGP